MTPVKPSKPVEVRAPRKPYYKIHEGWLQITPPNQDDQWRIRLSDVVFYRLKKNELILVGRGISETLRPQQFSDAERDEECREQLEKLHGMLDLYFSLDNTKIEVVSTPKPQPSNDGPASTEA